MNKTALITGTTSGIGKAFCERLARERCNLILVARNGPLLAKQANELRGTGIDVREIVCDLAKPDAAKTVLSAVSDAGLSVDILVNNAGFNEAGMFTETNLRAELDMISVHVSMLTELTKGVLPGMIERGMGHILNVGSIASYIPSPTEAVYAATKAYVLSFSSALHRELKGTGVTVTTLCPGATHTGFAGKSGIEATPLFTYFVMKPSRVAEIGCKAMMKGKRVVVPGIYNKLTVGCAKLLPASLTEWLAWRMLRR